MPPELVEYAVRIVPGLVVLGVLMALLRGPQLVAGRIVVLLAGFVLIRDAMTPVGLWEVGSGDAPIPWVRFIDDPVLLLVLAGASGLTVAAVLAADADLRGLVRWGPADLPSIVAGLVGALVIAVPVLALSAFTPIEQRGGEVAVGVLLPLLVFALIGNLLEEVLFRGFLQGWLEGVVGAIRAVWLSALAFAAGHVFLASTVTDVGWPLLAFVAYEGLVCAILRRRDGVLAAALAHGLGVFLIASGLI